jgi:membrane protein implicated in regulation of membrane protease activity
MATLGRDIEVGLRVTDQDDDEIIGGVGYVTTRIDGSGHAGEVQVGLRGGSESFIAYATETIERGQQVMVVGRRPGRGLDVIALAG